MLTNEIIYCRQATLADHPLQPRAYLSLIDAVTSFVLLIVYKQQ